jgi:hypothetical protein
MKKPAQKKAAPVSTTRREIAKKATYVIPAVLTLSVVPSFASAASGPHPPHPRRKRK